MKCNTTQRDGRIGGLLSSVLLAAVLLTGGAASATVTWDGEAGDGDWYNGLNWSTDTVPTATDDIEIPIGSPAADDRVYIATGSLTIGHADAYIQELNVAASATGNLRVFNGGRLTAPAAWFGFHPNSSATADVWRLSAVDIDSAVIGASGEAVFTFGVGSTSAFGSPAMGVGYGSHGRLVLESGSAVTTARDILVGGTGHGEIAIEGSSDRRGELFSHDAVLAQNPTSQAEVNVSGLWDIDGALLAGVAGHAVVNVVSDSAITAKYAVVQADELLAATELIGHYGSADITISGWGSLMDISGDAYIGDQGPATVTVSDYGNFAANDCYLGVDWHREFDEQTGVQSIVRSRGVLNIGNGCRADLANLFIGGEGDGEVSVEYGSLSVADRIYIARNIGGTGKLDIGVQGGVEANEVFVGGGYVEGENEFKQEGELTGDRGGLLIHGGLTLGRWAAVSRPDFQISIDGGYFRNESIFPERISLGRIDIKDTGNTFEVADAFDLLGTRPEPRGFEVAQLYLRDNCDLDLEDNVDNNPETPGADMLYVDTLKLGPGSVLRLNGLTVIYRELIDNGGTIEAGGGRLIAMKTGNDGDINSDGVTDIADFVALKQGYGSTAPGCPADLNLDGIVDIADFVILKKNYGI